MEAIYPLPNRKKHKPLELSKWQSGLTVPTSDGLYLREFDEGIATTEFHDGKWLRDGFFPSDIQDARWRGLKSPDTKA